MSQSAGEAVKSSRDIARAIGSVADAAGGTRDRMAESKKHAAKLSDLANDLERLVGPFQ